MVINVSLLWGLVGCDDPAAGTAPIDRPVPVASLRLANGNAVEFYDFGDGALVTESGAAYTAPSAELTTIPAGGLVNVWQKLAPADPAPQALIDLQSRLVQVKRDDRAPAVRVATKVAPRMEGGGDSLAGSKLELSPRKLVGCANGCCDEAWLKTLPTCFYTGWDDRWFYFNGGYSYANSSGIYHFRGLVCSAIGQSEWTVKVAGHTYSLPVKEATYLNWSWVAGESIWCAGFCAENLKSTVNSPSDRHLHTYCGMVQYD
jgi:hypothetical protein